MDDRNRIGIKAVLFDMDGLLLRTEELYLQAVQLLFEQEAIQLPYESALEIIGLSTREGMSLLRSRFRARRSVDELEIRYHELFDELSASQVNLCRGVEKVLCIVRRHGYSTAVVTSTNELRAVRLLKQAHIDDYFEDLITADEVALSKPDPAIYKLACQRLGVEPISALAFEDSGNGVLSAATAGCTVIAVPHELTASQDFSGALRVVDRLDSPFVFQFLKGCCQPSRGPSPDCST